VLRTVVNLDEIPRREWKEKGKKRTTDEMLDGGKGK
jgi:hypothetical protein